MRPNIRKGLLAAAALGLAGLFGTVGVAAENTSILNQSTKEYDLDVRSNSDAVTFPKGISIQGRAIEGMTVDEVNAWVSDYVAQRQNRPVTLTVFTDNIFNYLASNFGVVWSNPDVTSSLADYTTDGNFIKQYKNQKDLEHEPVSLQLQFGFDAMALREQVQGLANSFYADPINATATRTPEGFAITDGVNGRSFNVDGIVNELSGLITDYENVAPITYDLPYDVLVPQYTAETFAGFTVLGQYFTTNLGPNPNRIHNIQVSSQRVNGTMIFPGETASALKLYGAQSLDNGYLIAPGYLNGRQVDVAGGGVCQTTTTLYNALIRAKWPKNFITRAPHSMLVTYVPPGLDAAVSEGSKDMKFTNPFQHPVYLESYVDGDRLFMIVWGVDETPNVKVDFDYGVESVEWPNPLYNVVVDDSQVTYGPDCTLDKKLTAPVESHPRVVATSYRIVTTTNADGTVTVNREAWNHDTYGAMTGLLYVASDCLVDNSAKRKEELPDGTALTYPYLGWHMDHRVMFLNGADWNPLTARKNYYGIPDETQPQPQPQPEETEAAEGVEVAEPTDVAEVAEPAAGEPEAAEAVEGAEAPAP